jgi:hypothetical protein
MSFSSFGPLPTPQPNPVSGLPALEAAIRRLEATCPTPASTEAGAISPTPAGQETGGTPGAALALQALGISPTPAGQETGGTPHVPASMPLWRLVAALLAQIDPDVRYDVRRLFECVLEAVEDDLALPPERRRLAPRSLREQQEGRPCAQVTARQCQQGRQAVAFLLR